MLIGLKKTFCGRTLMSELVTKSVAQEQQQQNIEARTTVERIAGFSIVGSAVAAIAILVATAVYAQVQDKYSLKSPSGIAFSDFMTYDKANMSAIACKDTASERLH